jgi:hypothetical protein
VKGEVPVLPLIAVSALSFLALALSGGELLATAAPVIAVAFLYAEWRAPLRVCAVGLFFLSLIADAPQDNPAGGKWQSPLYALGRLLCDNWSKTFTVAALPFSGMDLLCLVLLSRILFRRFLEHPEGRSGRVAAPLWRAGAAFLAALLLLGAIGIARAGNFGAAYWQIRQFMCIPLFAYLLTEALEGEHDHRLLGPLILAAALIKTAAGVYFHFFIDLPQGLDSPVITSHADTMLFCVSVALVGLLWLESPGWPALRRCLWFVPVVMLAVFLNNRRLAYVGLAAVFATIWLFVRPNRAKRSLARAGLVATPFLIGYLVVGWGSDAALFKPVASVHTIVAADENAHGASESTRSREIENFNLSQTLRQHPVGTGLGQEYEEVVKGPDISREFALYRYIPHNSVLWLMSMAGPIGFFLIWSMFGVGAFLAARAYRFATDPADRVAALTALCAQLLFLIQAYGDMGTQSWSTTWLVAAAFAVSGKLAVSTGAWPAQSRGAALQLAWEPL